MFIRKSKIKNYFEKRHQKEIKAVTDFWQNENRQIAKEKNAIIEKLQKDKKKYIDKSFALDSTMDRIERLDYLISDSLGKLKFECNELRHEKVKNDRFILKNEDRFEVVK